MKQVTVLGATGSIGESTLDIIEQHPDKYSAFALTANENWHNLATLCAKYRPQYAVLPHPDNALRLQQTLIEQNCATEVLVGQDGFKHVCQHKHVDIVMAAIVGAAGLKPTLYAVKAGKRVLLANKEALVMSGPLFMDAVAQHNAELLPVDSEHNAIFQCLPPGLPVSEAGVKKILLTGSGGPFLELPLSRFGDITPAQACKHPNWDMGKKISVDSATMMNKGLELIEACYLFGVSHRDIQIVIHPQSVVHSMVEFVDGSVIAQLGQPDMRTPIAHAMAWPDRINSGVRSIDFFKLTQLAFTEPDDARFPALSLAKHAIEFGRGMPAVLNAANEVAVNAFLHEKIPFNCISRVIEMVLSRYNPSAADSIDSIVALDREARRNAEEVILKL